jgi:hypothetical protein
MLFNTRVLEIWVMKITNIYEFLHLLRIIKIKPNMDFGGNLALVHIFHKTHSIFFFFFQGEWRKARVDKPTKWVRCTPWLSFIYLLNI